MDASKGKGESGGVEQGLKVRGDAYHHKRGHRDANAAFRLGTDGRFELNNILPDGMAFLKQASIKE